MEEPMKPMMAKRTGTVLGLGVLGGALLWMAACGYADTKTPGEATPVMPRHVPTAEQLRAAYRRPPRQPSGQVYKARIAPHWFHHDTRFWYRNDLRGGAREFILVDAERGTRLPAFDHQRLAAALSK